MRTDELAQVAAAACTAEMDSEPADPDPLDLKQSDDLLVLAIEACLAVAPDAEPQYRIGLATAAALLNCDRLDGHYGAVSPMRTPSAVRQTATSLR